MLLTSGLLWLGFAIAVGVAAEKRYSRSGVGWFLLSLLISPLLGGLFLLAVGRTAHGRGVNWRNVDWSGKKAIATGKWGDPTYEPFERSVKLQGFWTALVRHPTPDAPFWDGDSLLKAILLSLIPAMVLTVLARLAGII